MGFATTMGAQLRFRTFPFAIVRDVRNFGVRERNLKSNEMKKMERLSQKKKRRSCEAEESYADTGR